MSRALDNLGPHLLGGRPLPPDPRDYQLSDYLAAHERLASSLTPGTTLAELAATGPLEAWHDVYAFWAWFKANILGATPTPAPPAPGPTPTPAPAVTVKEWAKLHGISDQGQTGHCVGFTGLDWGNTLNVDDAWPNQKGHDIYYACKVIDGEPGQENGSDSRSLCKVLKQMGRIGAYAFAATADEAAAYILAHGPVGIGIPWYQDMFTPEAGLLHVGGGVAGGHEIELNAYDSSSQRFKLVNHWGSGWGVAGCAYLRHQDLDRLLGEGGDCWAALELPA